jgi:hypothetical protein
MNRYLIIELFVSHANIWSLNQDIGTVEDVQDD